MVKKRTARTAKAIPPSSNEQLTKEEVYDVLTFANSAYNMYQGAYTPELVNARMKDISLSPQMATSDKIEKALSNPKENERQLIGYSEWMELNSMLYKRILGYFSGLMSFDMKYVCINADAKDYKTPAYKKDLKLVAEFFDKFNIKKEFKTALKQMLRQEAFFSVFRDEGDRYILQELPQQYCKITGRWDYGLVFDFNLYWFMQPTVSLDMYPSSLKKMLKRFFEGTTTGKYNPASTIDSRTGSWIYWAQTSPVDGFTAFKLFPEIATIVPYLSPLLGDAVLQPIIRALQKNSYIQQASKIIFGQVEFLKDATSKVKDALSLAPETLGKFLALMKSGLPDAIKVAAAPIANTSAIEFEGNNELYTSYLQATAASSGVNSRLLFTTDRQNVLETKLSLDIDQNVLRPVYSQFEDILIYWVNQRTKKFKFKFILDGFETSVNRDERFNNAMKLADSGIVLEQNIATSMGMSIFDFRRQLEETKANDFVKNLTPILKSPQMPSDGGRPAKEDGDLSDSGSDTKSAGSNEEKSED